MNALDERRDGLSMLGNDFSRVDIFRTVRLGRVARVFFHTGGFQSIVGGLRFIVSVGLLTGLSIRLCTMRAVTDRAAFGDAVFEPDIDFLRKMCQGLQAG